MSNNSVMMDFSGKVTRVVTCTKIVNIDSFKKLIIELAYKFPFQRSGLNFSSEQAQTTEHKANFSTFSTTTGEFHVETMTELPSQPVKFYFDTDTTLAGVSSTLSVFCTFLMNP